MRKIVAWTLLALTIFWCFFIWHFSLADASASDVSSGRVTETLNTALENLHTEFRVGQHFVRKAAHFCEFFALGILLSATLVAFRVKYAFYLSLPILFAVAAIDECLQLFSPGRAAALSDVLLDTSGGICGILLVFGAAIWCRWREENEKSEKPEKNT